MKLSAQRPVARVAPAGRLLAVRPLAFFGKANAARKAAQTPKVAALEVPAAADRFARKEVCQH